MISTSRPPRVDVIREPSFMEVEYMPTACRRVAGLLVPLIFCLGGALPAQEMRRPAVAPPSHSNADPADAALALHAYTLKNQPVGEALQLVYPLLSERGSVEVRPEANTLVIRDSIAALSRIIPLLSQFDHPPRPVRVELYIVRATGQKFSPAPPPRLPESLLRRLRELLPYQRYEVLAQTDLAPREGERVSYRLGDSFQVDFRVGTLVEAEGGARLKLHGFRVTEGKATAAARQLLHTNLNLRLGQTLALGLAASEASEHAMMVVLSCTAAGAAAP